MLVFTQDKFVKIWFSLWKVTVKGFEKVEGRYPLEYTDSRFHRALEKLLTGQYVAIECGKFPENSKALQINYTEAEQYYNDGLLVESPPNFVVDWHQLFKKFDDIQAYKKEQSELELREQVQEDINFLNSANLCNKALLNAVELHKQGRRVPAFILPDVLEYIAVTYRNQRGNTTKTDY